MPGLLISYEGSNDADCATGARRKVFSALLREERIGPSEAARAVIIPFGLEASVCYGAGTARGPEAIIAASPQLDFFDEELWCEPYREFGIATLEPLPIAAGPSRRRSPSSTASSRACSRQGKFPLALGGEHSLTAGGIRPFVRRHPDLVVVCSSTPIPICATAIWASPYSHAAAMRRVLDHQGVSLVWWRSAYGHLRRGDRLIEANAGRVTIHWAKDRSAGTSRRSSRR